MKENKSKKPDEAQFDDWLQHRIDEAKLKPGELAEFTRWLDARSADQELKSNQDANVEKTDPVSAKEFVELISWLKNRIKFGRNRF